MLNPLRDKFEGMFTPGPGEIGRPTPVTTAIDRPEYRH